MCKADRVKRCTFNIGAAVQRSTCLLNDLHPQLLQPGPSPRKGALRRFDFNLWFWQALHDWTGCITWLKLSYTCICAYRVKRHQGLAAETRPQLSLDSEEVSALLMHRTRCEQHTCCIIALKTQPFHPPRLIMSANSAMLHLCTVPAGFGYDGDRCGG